MTGHRMRKETTTNLRLAKPTLRILLDWMMTRSVECMSRSRKTPVDNKTSDNQARTRTQPRVPSHSSDELSPRHRLNLALSPTSGRTSSSICITSLHSFHLSQHHRRVHFHYLSFVHFRLFCFFAMDNSFVCSFLRISLPSPTDLSIKEGLGDWVLFFSPIIAVALPTCTFMASLIPYFTPHLILRQVRRSGLGGI